MNDVKCRWCTLPETNSEFSSENGWLEDDFFFLLGYHLVRCYVRFSKGNHVLYVHFVITLVRQNMRVEQSSLR